MDDMLGGSRARHNRHVIGGCNEGICGDKAGAQAEGLVRGVWWLASCCVPMWVGSEVGVVGCKPGPSEHWLRDPGGGRLRTVFPCGWVIEAGHWWRVSCAHGAAWRSLG